MTQQPTPPMPNPPTNGGSGAPPTGWNPTPLSATGRASYANQTAPTPATSTTNAPAIEQFSPKRSKVPILAAVVGVVIAALVIFSATRPSEPQPQPTPAPTTANTAPPTLRDGSPFTIGSSTSGSWKSTQSKWSKTGLDVLIEVRVTSGTLNCYFESMTQSGTKIIKGQDSKMVPDFPINAAITSGESASGWVHFPLERGLTTVYLRTYDSASVSAIEIAG